jgi:hypothetical protein
VFAICFAGHRLQQREGKCICILPLRLPCSSASHSSATTDGPASGEGAGGGGRRCHGKAAASSLLGPRLGSAAQLVRPSRGSRLVSGGRHYFFSNSALSLYILCSPAGGTSSRHSGHRGSGRRRRRGATSSHAEMA